MKNFGLKTLLYSIVVFAFVSMIGGIYLIANRTHSAWSTGRANWFEAWFMFSGSMFVFLSLALILGTLFISPLLSYISSKIDWEKKVTSRHEVVTEAEYKRRRLNNSF
jgi:hypothetical protein